MISMTAPVRLLKGRPSVSKLLLAGFFLLCSVPGLALDPHQPLGQLHHTSWTSREGLTGSVDAIAQTSDGYLWLGTTDGLFRFDGVAFERYRADAGLLRDDGVSALLALPNGDLWVGYTFGGASLLRKGRFTNYALLNGPAAKTDGFPAATVRGFAQTRDGTIWVGATGGLARLDGDHWLRVGREWRGSGGQVHTLFVDAAGNLWVSTFHGLHVLPKGAALFQSAGEETVGEQAYPYLLSMAQAHDGTLWGARCCKTVEQIHAPGDARRQAFPGIEISAFRIIFDRDGAMWLAGNGIARIPFAPFSGHRAETLTYKEHLTGVYARSLLEDREGNIWIGTEGGLERFRHRNLSWFSLLPGTRAFSLIAGDNGDIFAWPYSITKELDRGIRVRDGKLIEGEPSHIRSAFRDSNGTVYLAGTSSLWTWQHGHFLKVPPAEPGSILQVTAITTDDENTLWVSEMGRGVSFRKPNGKWNHVVVFQDSPTSKADAACSDADGRVWFTFFRQVAVLDHGRLTTFSEGDGLAVGNISQIASAGRQMWVGGRSGLAFLQGSRFHTVKIARGNSLGSVRDILTTPNDGLWLNATPGIVHIPQTEIQQALRDPNYKIAFDVFDVVSDLPEVLQEGVGSPSIVRGSDGFLWFATRQGVARVDPRHLVKNEVPPPVSIRSIVADGISYSTFAAGSLPPLTRDLQIDYTALSLAIPEKIRFRYKLTGRDTEWRDAGGRRQAFYTNLEPKRYTFHVIACNNDGVWNEAGAEWSFEVKPAVDQTRWFEWFCIALAGATAWCLYVFRLRLVTAEMQARLGERLAERERIARELHDTLLQGFYGLTLRFEAVMKQIPHDASARRLMESALERADQVLSEGRSRVRDLRADTTTMMDLADSLSACGRELAEDGVPAFSLDLIGTPRPLDPIVHDEIYRTGREALINAFRHSRAAKIEAEITYTDTHLLLKVRDNGCGIEQKVLETGRPGHWGLSGIRERTEKIGGRVNIWSGTGVGTEIELTIPASVAYRFAPRTSMLRRVQHWLRQESARVLRRDRSQSGSS